MVLRFGIGYLGNRLFGNNEDVNWGLGVNVFEGEGEVVLIDNVGGNFPTGEIPANPSSALSSIGKCP